MIINLLNPIIVSTSYKMMADEEAVEHYLKTQNVNYFNLIYDRYTNKVYAKCISMLKDNEAAEDATQEIFVKILLSLSRFTGKSKFSTWIYSITYNYCIDMIRREKKDIEVAVNDFSRIDHEDDNIFDAEILETNISRLRVVLNHMNAEDKSILMMKYQDDLSIREICDMLNKTESAVKMKILRAKEKFIKIYKEHYNDKVS